MQCNTKTRYLNAPAVVNQPMSTELDGVKINGFLYRISANSFRGNYSFLKVLVRKVFKGGKYSREETIVFFHFLYV